jgi:hypothetical protein
VLELEGHPLISEYLCYNYFCPCFVYSFILSGAGKPPKFEARNMNTKPIESEGPLVISGQEYERDKVYTRTNKGLSSGGSKGKSTQSPKPLSASGPTFSKKKKSRSRAGLRAMVAQVGSTTGTPETIEGLRRSPRLKHLLEMVTKAWLHLLQAQPGAPPLRSRPPFLPTKRVMCTLPFLAQLNSLV